MSSEAREAALTGAVPVKLFKFTRAATSWCYTDADRQIEFAGDSYLPTAISHTGIKDNSEPNQAGISVNFPKDLPIADNWRQYAPSDPVSVSIFTLELGEGDVLLDYAGRVVQPQFDNTTLTLQTEPSATRARRGGGQRRFQRACDLVLYSQGPGMCGVDQAAHTTTATLTAVDESTLTAVEFGGVAAGRLAGGRIQWTRGDGFTDRRSINAHDGEVVTLDYPAADLAIGSEVTAVTGCGQDWDSCDYYGNTPRYGGELYIPDRDYYDGNPI